MTRIKVLLLTLSVYTALLAQSTDPQKVITRSTMIGLGTSNVLDTYLSQEHFTGLGMSFLSTIERNRTDCRWSTIMEHEANISSIKDRPDMKHELEGAYNFYWGKLYSWQLMDNRLKLQAGGLVNASLGVIYNTSNSNNPAQARAHLNVIRIQPAIGGYHVLAQLRTVVLRDFFTGQLRPQHRTHDLCLCSRMAPHADYRYSSHHATLIPYPPHRLSRQHATS